jgi:signal transduction histidine kinase
MEEPAVRVLLVDDDENEHILVNNLLKAACIDKFDLTWVATYEQCLEAVKTSRWDVCLLDYRLGWRSGLDLMAEVLTIANHPPVILMTGVGDRDVDVAATKAGAADYLVKGEVTASLLERSIRYAMERERTLAAIRARDLAESMNVAKSAFVAQLEAANKELQAFAYAASHDLKAPLRVIDNCSKWIEEDLQEHLAGETRENMNLLRGRIKRMEKLLDDLLDYARIGQATDARYAETIAGNRLLNDIGELLVPVGFTLKVSPAFAHIQVPTMPLQQILMNLIGNAIKHHNKKTGCIEVTVEDLGSQYAFAVKDDGPGIPARFHEQIFDMFQTLRPRDQVEGSGMGLAIVRKHVLLHGGTIQVESSEGEGSIFRFTWPTQRTLREEAA